jgi:hypothetical protein
LASFSTSSNNNNNNKHNGFRIQPPSVDQPTTSWERGAARIKDPKQQQQTSTTKTTNQYMETIRATHDPSLPIRTLEDELKSTIAHALGKQGAKIVTALQHMERTREEYENLLLLREQQCSQQNKTSIRECAKRHNEFRKQAMTARWELLVHRQAVGFIVNNHSLVMEKFPIGDALPVDDDE